MEIWKSFKNLFHSDSTKNKPIRRRYIMCDGEKIRLDETYESMTVQGTGLSIYGILDDSDVIVQKLTDEDKFNIDKRPIVAIQESGEYFYENNTSLKKFVSYIDICPESAKSYSKDVTEHAQDASTFVLPHSYDIDPSGFSLFYSLNHSILKGIKRMEFIQLCTLTLQKMIRDKSVTNYNFHQMSIVCACYSGVMNYQIIPTEFIKGRVRFLISTEDK